MTAKRDLMIPPQGGMLRDFILRVKLIVRLVRDRRISFWLKLIPLVGVGYLLSPLGIWPEDFALPVIGVLDDATVLWLTNYVFIELCPPEIVQEHVSALSASNRKLDPDDIVDAESVEIKEQTK